MHIPDGMLSTPTWTTAWIGAAGAIGYGLRQVRKHLSDSRLVLMAVLAALIFALQMLNFPVAGGTSGHFVGGAAAAIIVGPWPAVIIMATVLLVQSLIFADGGITALGANVINMAVVGPFVGWWTYTILKRISFSRTWTSISTFVAAWLSCVVASIVAALMVWISGAAPFGLVLGSMSLVHAIIGIGEGLITAGLIAYLLAVRPDLLRDRDTDSTRGAVIGISVMAAVAAGISFLASSHPDGLEHVAESLGFLTGSEPVFGASPIPDYVIPGIANETLAGVLAGLVGIVITAALAYSLLITVRRRRADA